MNLIRKCIPALAVSLAVSGAMVSTGEAAMRGHHVPGVVSHLRPLGHLDNTNVLHLSIGLPVRNETAMKEMLQQVYDPKSTNYHKFITPQKFAEMFGPTETDYQAVIAYAQQNGLTVEGMSPNHMLLKVVGHTPAVEKAFHVTMHTYQHPTETRKFFSPDSEPSVPDQVPIQDVSGLENYHGPRANFHIKSSPVTGNNTISPLKVGASAAPNAGSGIAGLYIGDDFRNAYVPGVNLNGSGQSIAMVEFNGYLASDIAQYASMAGRTNIPLTNILLDGFSGAPIFNGQELEVPLDIELAMAMAPALSHIYVYEGDPSNFHQNDVLNQIANDNLAHQVGCSWTWTGGPDGTTEQIFVQMALQGQTFLASSGDDDAYTPGQADDPFSFSAPVNSPNITVVGGTSLTMIGNGQAWSSEQVWNFDNGNGSGGGFSSFYPIPTWQTNINMAAVGGSASGRNFPDVAMVADQVVAVSDGGTIFEVFGTSISSQLWAGYIAMVNQLASNNGKAPVGFINPALYRFANSPNYNNDFHDITVGDNTSSASPTLFHAAVNYDLCTGLGTPNGLNLLVALASSVNPITHIPPPPPPYGTTMANLNSGDPNGNWSLFIIDSQQFDSGVISNGWFVTLTTADVIGQAADVAITKTVSTNSVAVGNNVTFYITVTNYGPSLASNVLVDDSLPLNADYLSNSVSAGSVVLTASDVLWNVGNLGTNTGAQMTVTMRANATGDIINNAIVTTTTPDENPDDNAASATTTGIVIITQPVQLLGSYIGGASGGFQITGTNTLGGTIIIQASTNFVAWTGIFTNTPPPSTFSFIDHDATNYPMRFYRSITGP